MVSQVDVYLKRFGALTS